MKRPDIRQAARGTREGKTARFATTAKRSRFRAPGTRGAFLSIELVLTLPILTAVLMALFEFCLLFFARSSLVEACRAGARKGTLALATTEIVEAEILRVLNPQLQTGMQVEFIPGFKSGDVVTVAVSVPMASAAPDLLWPFGYSLEGQKLYAETSMIKE